MPKYCKLSYYDQTKAERYLRYQTQKEELSWEQVITYVNLELDRKFYSYIKQIKYPDRLTVLVNKYNKLPNDYIPKDLEAIYSRYNIGTLKLRHEARKAFESMCQAAEEEGLVFAAVSAFRSYSYQEEVYLRKIMPDMTMDEYCKERDKVSARPGHSEHQTGLAVDINELEQNFENTPEGRWLAEKAYKFGFILRYPKGKEKITGYDYEPWHFRYVGCGLSEAVFPSGITYDEYYAQHL
jgi:D-alanyl-D-alanine carboxypeptidase